MNFSAPLIVSKIVWKESLPFHNNRTLVARENLCLKIRSMDGTVSILFIRVRSQARFYINSAQLERGEAGLEWAIFVHLQPFFPNAPDDDNERSP